MLEALKIVADSWPIAFMIVAAFGGMAIMFIIFRTTRDPDQHQEAMARLEAAHREAMLKINREQPKLVGGNKNPRTFDE